MSRKVALFVGFVVVLIVLLSAGVVNRNGAPPAERDIPAAIKTTVPGIYLVPNVPDGRSDRYPQSLELFLKEHEHQGCVLVGDYIVGGSLYGHYFRCSCPSSDAPPPCENGSIPAQELTTE